MAIRDKTILAIGGHPDDIEYWAGGTMVKLAKENRLIYVVATNGEIGDQPSVRKKEQEEASKLVGVKKLIFLGYPDSELETEGANLRRDLLEIILKKKPDMVFSFDPENQFCLQLDSHPDHRVLSLIVADLILIYTTLPAYIKKMSLSLKPLKVKPELWLFNPKNPNYFEDISEIWPRKIELLKIFNSQNLDIEASKMEAKKAARKGKVVYAESFHRVNFYSKIEKNED